MAKWKLELTEKFDFSFQKLNLVTQKRIYEFLHVKLLNHPDPQKLAKSLHGNLKGLHRYRVGDYRILVQIKKDILTIIAVDVSHRRNVYRN